MALHPGHRGPTRLSPPPRGAPRSFRPAAGPVSPTCAASPIGSCHNPAKAGDCPDGISCSAGSACPIGDSQGRGSSFVVLDARLFLFVPTLSRFSFRSLLFLGDSASPPRPPPPPLPLALQSQLAGSRRDSLMVPRPWGRAGGIPRNSARPAPWVARHGSLARPAQLRPAPLAWPAVSTVLRSRLAPSHRPPRPIHAQLRRCAHADKTAGMAGLPRRCAPSVGRG